MVSITTQWGSMGIFPVSARAASSSRLIMERSWFTLRITVSRCSRFWGPLARQAVEDERDELMNPGQGCPQLVRYVGKELIFELDLLTPLVSRVVNRAWRSIA